MLLDKHRARKKMWRVPESTLFLTVFLGGAFGSLFGMLIANHKTRHASFMVFIPIMAAVQFFLYMLITKYM